MEQSAIRLDLTKLQGAFVATIKGKTASKQCICIPIEESHIYMGEKGAYLSLIANKIQNPKFEDTYFIKQRFDKETYAQWTEEERKAMPIIGGIRPIGTKANTAPEVDVIDDLPF